MNLEETLRFDKVGEIKFKKCPTYIHKSHRYALCVLYHAQLQGWLPTPCDLVMFDQHHDAIPPSCLSEIKQLRVNGLSMDALISLCQKNLRNMNDDWLRAGMELGLIADAVLFGVHNKRSWPDVKERHCDHLGKEHRIKILGRLYGELQPQGDLSDTARSDVLTWIWEILRWEQKASGEFSFAKESKPLWVDIDLDVFAIGWSDYILPWTDKIFCKEFLVRSESDGTWGWTGKDFLHGLLDRAGLFTIATEPKCCGGYDNVRQIAERLNHFVFDDKLKLPRLENDEE